MRITKSASSWTPFIQWLWPSEMSAPMSVTQRKGAHGHPRLESEMHRSGADNQTQEHQDRGHEERLLYAGADANAERQVHSILPRCFDGGEHPRNIANRAL